MRPEYLTIAISNLNFNFPPLIVHIQQQVVLKFRQRVFFVPRDAPSKNNIFVLNANTLPYLIVILVLTFQLLYIPRYQGFQIYTRGPHDPRRPQRRNFCTQSEYFTNYLIVFFNVNILGLVVSEILGVPNLRQGSLCPPFAPSGIFFVPEASTLLCLMAFLISTFQLFHFLRYQGVPNLHQGALCPPGRPIMEKFLYQKRLLHNI